MDLSYEAGNLFPGGLWYEWRMAQDLMSKASGFNHSLIAIYPCISISDRLESIIIIAAIISIHWQSHYSTIDLVRKRPDRLWGNSTLD